MRVRDLESQLIAAETRIGQLTASNVRKTDQVKHLATLLSAERRSADNALHGQAVRTAAVRQDNARLAGQVADLRRSWSMATADTDLSPEQVAALRDRLASLRDRLASLRDRHEELVTAYQRLSAAAEVAAAERVQLQGIVRQWDTLCRRLAKAVAGQTVSAADKKILATHKRFRSAVAGPDRGRPANENGGDRS
ncbi:chromosome segregation ATPase [Micrococcus cohnii]|uniref:Chromosome segregation ATPase n=1 Tax=Micrococcus cohnii TaxID=993416 RepID=A0A7W7M223_9MICC|nr:hypothetical protein [Micrococcus cohnii]MBB4734717.1 chromosome segregation ATPase [Micrococcus cohnii]